MGLPDKVRSIAYAARVADKAGDPREAVPLYRRTADLGHPLAQNNLGRMYTEGRGGLPRDTREAARMWCMAADQGSTEAPNNLRKLSGGAERGRAEMRWIPSRSVLAPGRPHTCCL